MSACPREPKNQHPFVVYESVRGSGFSSSRPTNASERLSSVLNERTIGGVRAAELLTSRPDPNSATGSRASRGGKPAQDRKFCRILQFSERCARAGNHGRNLLTAPRMENAALAPWWKTRFTTCKTARIDVQIVGEDLGWVREAVAAATRNG
jgi:hypothetical protein